MNRVAAERVAKEYVSRKKIARQEEESEKFFRLASLNKDAGNKEFLKDALVRFLLNPIKDYHRKAHLFFDTIDDLTDEVIKGVAPKLAEELRKSEVDSDVSEFEEGAYLRYRERSGPSTSRGGYFPDYDPPSGKSEDFYEGYEWGDKNSPPIPTRFKKRLVEEAAREHEEKITERAALKALKFVANALNPWEIIKHVFSFIKKKGWDVPDDVWYRKYPNRALKMLIASLTAVFAEFVEHVLVPKAAVWLTGDPSYWALSAVPFLEIGMAISSFFRKPDPSKMKPSHLEWYEKNFGDIDEIFEEEEEELSSSRRASYLY